MNTVGKNQEKEEKKKSPKKRVLSKAEIKAETAQKKPLKREKKEEPLKINIFTFCKTSCKWKITSIHQANLIRFTIR